MERELLNEAQRVARLLGTRIQVALPAVLAEGERFDARVSVTGPDALPIGPGRCTLHFEGAVGIEGLPRCLALDPDACNAVLGGLTAVGPHTALVRARVECEGGREHAAWVTSNPAWVFKEPPYRLFWGDLHVHTSYSNCHAWRCLDPAWCYRYARDVSLLDFVAPADHLRGIASDPARWPRLQELARRHNVPGSFVTFLAFESSHAQGFGGDNNVYYLDDDAPYFWAERDDMRGIAPRVPLRALWEALDGNGKPYFTVPHHTGRAGKYRTWDDDVYDPQREPLFEIYSSWGSSERRHTRLPMSGGNNDAPSYWVDALRAGTRFGLIASSDDHATLPGSVHHHRTEPFSPPSLNGFAHKGLAAVRAPALTREALFTALRSRDVYATTHARSLLEVDLGDGGMGEALRADGPLRKERRVRVRFTLEGSTSARVFLVRNGEELDAQSVRGAEVATAVNEVVFRDAEPLDRVALRGARFHEAPFVAYYVRMEDGNGAHQWASPIWIDLD